MGDDVVAIASEDSFDARARQTFYDPSHPAAFGSVARLAKALGDRGGDKTRTWLRGQDAYTLHRQSRRKFQHRPTIVSGPGVQLQADLMDTSSLASDNDNVKFLLTIVDVFSRLAWVQPLRNKSGAEVARALQRAVGGLGYRKLQTDKGREFYNVSVTTLLDEERIKHFSSENDVVKAALVERFNRTLRGKIHAYLTYTKRRRYIDVVDDMVSAYNETKHSAIGLAPRDVNASNADDIFVQLYEPGPKSSPTARTSALESGQYVRTSKWRGAFKRGYTEQWTREIFVISSTRHWEQPVVYTLKDLADEPIEGMYYGAELQRVEKPETFVVERVLRTRGRGRARERLVKWLGYPASFNSWVADVDFV